MKTNFSAIALALLLTAASLPAFAAPNHDHDGPQIPRRWSRSQKTDTAPDVKAKEGAPQDDKSAAQNMASNKKDGRDIGSIQSSWNSQLQGQKIEAAPEKSESKPVETESETPRRRPPHHTGVLGS